MYRGAAKLRFFCDNNGNFALISSHDG